MAQIYGEIVAFFGLIQFHSDSIGYWHTLDSMAQFGSVYAGLLLESSRHAHGFKLLIWYLARYSTARTQFTVCADQYL
ncbi:hypothetical protein VFPPC_17433 [Pochonia chlamydosporia 170]|uniref:Uncharacterized protein n=1 Tax=Pochonia chlamydosporia 170 TaxID=1380566 RepID=A0A219ARK8_METCM|nr:hypothetical protein VFPPC_17433 [Pochonia chlamydosporia 170]OWT43418.1 hypothetical protein VFPPC_17433 [Pochonia chlamydosporia 170]